MNSFSHINVTLAGELDARMQISDEMLCAIPNSEEAIESFCQNFNNTPAAFESRFILSSMPRVVIHWHLAGNGAGLAQLFCEGDAQIDMLLLLSGIDQAADEAAIRAAEVWISEPPRSPKSITVFQDIRRAPRPLLVSLSKSRFAERTVHVELIEWTFAAAFFRVNPL